MTGFLAVGFLLLGFLLVDFFARLSGGVSVSDGRGGDTCVLSRPSYSTRGFFDSLPLRRVELSGVGAGVGSGEGGGAWVGDGIGDGIGDEVGDGIGDGISDGIGGGTAASVTCGGVVTGLGSIVK